MKKSLPAFNVANTNENSDKTNEESLTDLENHRKNTTAKIDANDLSIAEFKAKIASLAMLLTSPVSK